MLISAGAIVAASSAPAGADSAPTFYLAVGASASVGYQPALGWPHGHSTERGYANDLAAIEASRGLALELDQVGCPGETTGDALDGGDRCYQPPTTQVSTATAFLRSHQNDSGLVTIDLGFNNVLPCLVGRVVDWSCVDSQLAVVTQQLGTIVGDLRAAAGPDVRFVGINHYDPFVADPLVRHTSPVFASQSVRVIERLDASMGAVYRGAGFAVADVAAAFKTGDTATVGSSAFGAIPAEAAQVCQLTWMCQRPPLGPNLHPNDAGYLAMARAIASVVPSSL
jgi:hypothetical protein